MFVTIDGLDGSGKTTLVSTLSKAIAEDGRMVSSVHFPGTSELGGYIRTYLMRSEQTKSPLLESLLLFANFVEVHRDWRGADSARVLIADRFYTSTFAYQGAASGNAELLIRKMVRVVFSEISIDVRIILDVPFSVSKSRLAGRHVLDRFDLVDEPDFNERRQLMLRSVRLRPRAVVIDSTWSREAVANKALRIIRAHSTYPEVKQC